MLLMPALVSVLVLERPPTGSPNAAQGKEVEGAVAVVPAREPAWAALGKSAEIEAAIARAMAGVGLTSTGCGVVLADVERGGAVSGTGGLVGSLAVGGWVGIAGGTMVGWLDAACVDMFDFFLVVDFLEEEE